MLEGRVIEDGHGTLEFSLTMPITTHKSMDCFELAVMSGNLYSVLMADLRPASITSHVMKCFVDKPSYVCNVDPTYVMKRMNAQRKPRTVASSSSSKPGPEPDSIDEPLDEFDEADFVAAQEAHDDGLTVAHATEDSENQERPLVSDQDKEEFEMSEVTRDAAIRKARTQGKLPTDVEVSLFGGMSCMTADELEMDAVENHLTRHGILRRCTAYTVSVTWFHASRLHIHISISIYVN